MSYAGLRNELRTLKGLMSLNRDHPVHDISLRDIAGLSKMGFSKIRGEGQGESFAAARDRQPQEVQNLLRDIGNRAVPINGNANDIQMSNGQPVSTNFDPIMAALGQRFRSDPSLLDTLSRDIRENPDLLREIPQAVDRNPSAMARAIREYNGGNGQLEGVMSSILRPASGAPAATPAEAAASPASAEAPSIEPIAVAAEAAASPPAPAATAAPEAMTWTGQDLVSEGGLMEVISAELLKLHPDMENDIETFQNRIRSDTALQERIAANLNNNPEFMAEFSKFSEGQSGDAPNEMIRNATRSMVRDILNNPDKLADDAYLDDLTSKLRMGSNPMMAGLGGMLGGIAEKLMGFIQPLIQMFGDMFKGFNGGGANLMSMGNGNGSLLENFMGNISQMGQLGGQIRQNERYINAEGRAVDRNNDGSFTEADMVEVTDIAGRKHRGYEMANIADGHDANGNTMRAYASQIDPATGRVTGNFTITVAPDGAVTRTDADAPPATAAPIPAPVQQNAANDPNAPGLNQNLTPPTGLPSAG